MFRKIIGALRDITTSMDGIHEALRELPGAFDDADRYEGLRARLDLLEGPLRAKLGEVEGLLAKVEGIKQATLNAEQRSRGVLARAEDLTAGDEDEPEEDPHRITQGDVERFLAEHGGPGDQSPVPPVRTVVEELTRLKFPA